MATSLVGEVGTEEREGCVLWVFAAEDVGCVLLVFGWFAVGISAGVSAGVAAA